MRILTVRQPWAWAIVHGQKDVENRSRNIAGDYRGPVLIHAGSAWDWDTKLGVIETPHPTSVSLVRGAIIGVVDLVDSHPVESCCQQQHDGDWLVCSEWAERSGFHLVLENPRALDEPIPYKGALGLRKADFAIVGETLAAPWGHLNRSCTPYGCEPGCELEPVAKLIAADITRMEQGT